MQIPACHLQCHRSDQGIAASLMFDQNISKYFCCSFGIFLTSRHSTLFYPPLPSKKTKAIRNIAFGTVNKVVLLFEMIWWPTDVSFFSFLWNDEDLAAVHKDDEWTTFISGVSLSMANESCLVFWLNGKEAILVSLQSPYAWVFLSFLLIYP